MMPQKTIAILLNTSWYIYNFRKNLIKELQKKGYKVIAIAPTDEYSSKLEELGCSFHHLDIDSKSKNPLYDISLLFRIRKILAQTKPDVLLNFTIKPNVYGSLAARSLGIACINNVAGMGTLFSDGFFSRTILKALFKVSQYRVRTVFFQNPDDMRELTASNIVNKSLAHLLPGSGVNLNEFPFSPLPQLENQTVNFLLVARMIRTKGIAELVQAGKILKGKGYSNFHINLLGEMGINNPHAISKEEMDEISSNNFVTYLGKTDKVKQYLQNSDAVVLPSYYREGTPKSLLEALAIGRPIITTDMPGCKQTVVNGVNGYICTPKSADDLASKMEAFLNLKPDQRLRMGIQSRKLAETKFDEQIVIAAYLKAIEKALN
ncbi:glycosyltransferase family 4 protein [uncultured Draconibacterium sp.]|uniref:glycosyltransferase family 4 protein n=1 Tax=uncultured Draconibacterium sp. TaxID=1573823 RepID=UPI0029C617FF|nr:glycosyltransferase family 4 protein [uncultured Draconibacterium sp.]